MAKFTIEVEYTFSGDFFIEADSYEEAKKIVENHCKMTRGRIKTTLNDEAEIHCGWMFKEEPQSFKITNITCDFEGFVREYFNLPQTSKTLNKAISFSEFREMCITFFRNGSDVDEVLKDFYPHEIETNRISKLGRFLYSVSLCV